MHHPPMAAWCRSRRRHPPRITTGGTAAQGWSQPATSRTVPSCPNDFTEEFYAAHPQEYGSHAFTLLGQTGLDTAWTTRPTRRRRPTTTPRWSGTGTAGNRPELHYPPLGEVGGDIRMPMCPCARCCACPARVNAFTCFHLFATNRASTPRSGASASAAHYVAGRRRRARGGGQRFARYGSMSKGEVMPDATMSLPGVYLRTGKHAFQSKSTLELPLSILAKRAACESCLFFGTGTILLWIRMSRCTSRGMSRLLQHVVSDGTGCAPPGTGPSLAHRLDSSSGPL